MDRMIHTALNSVRTIDTLRSVSAQNLSNVAVPGFRRDIPNPADSAFMMEMNKLSPRAFALESGKDNFSNTPGHVNATDVDTDVAIVGDGYFYVQNDGGDPGLSRRGDLSVDGTGVLRNGAGQIMLDDTLAPINVPPYREIQISEMGEILINPIDAEPGQFQPVGVIGTTSATGADLRKGIDGLIRAADGTVPAADQSAKLAQRFLEGANVDPVEELVYSLELQRQFELNIKLIKNAEELDQSGSELLRLPNV